MNYEKALIKLINDSYIKYNGYLIEKQANYFIALGESHPSLEQAKEAIDHAYNSLRNSILKTKP